MGIQTLLEEIEDAVRAREGRRLRELSQKLLRSSRGSLEARLKVSDGYRRMGWFRDAYLLVQPEEWSVRPVSTRTPRGAQQLACARLVNLLGGTAIAVSMLKRLEPTSSPDHRLCGNIHLSAYDYESALSHFRKAIDLDPASESYEAKLGRIGEADCVAYLGDPVKALRLLGKIRISPKSEPLLQGIRLQASGEYLCLSGQWAEAEAALNEARDLFPPGDSPDHGFLHKWLGYSQARRKRAKQARESFRKALKILQRPAIRAETWLDTFRLMNEVGLLSGKEKPFLAIYPGLPRIFIEKAGFSGPIEVGDPRAEWWISESRGEWAKGGQHHFTLPKEVRLIALLKRAAHHGIEMTRLESLLWPEEVGAFPLLDQRLHLLLNRLKKVHRLHARIEERSVSLPAEDLSRIAVEFSTERLPLTYFESNESFAPADFRYYYGAGKSQASLRLRDALDSGEIIRAPATSEPNLRYQVRRL